MKIVDLDKAHERAYLVCLEEWDKEMMENRHIKETWLHIMQKKGLRAKVSLNEKGEVTGMIEYVPIEYSYADGEDLYFINCIWVHGYEDKGIGHQQGKGIGTALLQAAEEDVRSMAKKGIVAWGISENFWMTAAWYQKHGYEKVDQHKWSILVWKPFTEDAKPPRWIKGEYTQEQIPGKVKVTAFYSGQCPAENCTYARARLVAREFGNTVVFEVINMSDDENRRKYALKGGLYINGENISKGPPPSCEEIRDKISKALNKLTDRR
jgi:GNAT superfamily N-acetyltransferase